MKVQVICFFLFILVVATSSRNLVCPFDYLYHFGDGVTDIGNSILLPGGSSCPATRLPYGSTYPGYPDGRWFDGLIDIDFAACADILANALVLSGDIQANDIGYPLSQGKSLTEAGTYSLLATKTQLDVLRELIRMGATRIVIPGNPPIGCYPYILNDSTAYDDLGCLKSVNNLITSKNLDLQIGINNTIKEFPNVTVFCGAFGDGVLQVLQETLASGLDPLKACCGIGGKYNYDSKRFCASEGVPVCSNPSEYVFWDGKHFTQEAYLRIERILIQGSLASFNCTSPRLSASM